MSNRTKAIESFFATISGMGEAWDEGRETGPKIESDIIFACGEFLVDHADSKSAHDVAKVVLARLSETSDDAELRDAVAQVRNALKGW